MSLSRHQVRTLASLGGGAMGAGTAMRNLRKARAKSDKLALLDALLSLAAVLTSIALVVRALREDD
jgi:hypothetical protein